MSREDNLERMSVLYLKVPMKVIAEYLSIEEQKELCDLYYTTEKVWQPNRYWIGRAQ